MEQKRNELLTYMNAYLNYTFFRGRVKGAEDVRNELNEFFSADCEDKKTKKLMKQIKDQVNKIIDEVIGE